ncbi:MAG: hypothetical protein CMG71_01255 [Candidatus Marinimicrobia bacterium]|nr:hypothetical protein [Candidatus Neomarinimicrobiota bacterium]|tara:strand:- start:19632 stop:20816 length:1185 start_codon:yes stop_codon:yes gene_type:complete
MTLSEFLISIADKALSEPRRFIQPGCNGPYNDYETPVRNYGHWLITFSKCFELTGDKVYLEKIEQLAEYLISNDARPHGFSFHHRSKEGKDKCNGLVGQAWTFEALTYASSILVDQKYAELAEEVFFQHHFNVEYGLWNRLEIEGNILSIDNTFNHQLWFASCAALLDTPRRKEILGKVIQFIECLPQNVSVLDSGLIYHPIERNINQDDSNPSSKSKFRGILKSLLFFSSRLKGQSKDNNKEFNEKIIHKSVGYHQFNMYAFAALQESLPDHYFWKSSEIKKSVNFMLSNEFKNGLLNNIYGFSYNPPGFEVPYALSVLGNLNKNELVEISSLWVNEQIKRCYNTKTNMMDRNTNDYLTHTARIYELTRLPISILNMIEINRKSLGNFAQFID